MDAQYKRIEAILGEYEDQDWDKKNDIFYEYLKANISFPCEVTGIEDFQWEEFYVFGPGSKSEYKHFKRTSPSYTDKYMLLDIVRYVNSKWAMHNYVDIGGKVRRISDGKGFDLGLSELEATDKNSKNYELLNDYSVWFVNSR